jgi:hypothetical protein
VPAGASLQPSRSKCLLVLVCSPSPARCFTAPRYGWAISFLLRTCTSSLVHLLSSASPSPVLFILHLLSSRSSLGCTTAGPSPVPCQPLVPVSAAPLLLHCWSISCPLLGRPLSSGTARPRSPVPASIDRREDHLCTSPHGPPASFPHRYTSSPCSRRRRAAQQQTGRRYARLLTADRPGYQAGQQTTGQQTGRRGD